jgi:hypothetical protein
VSRGDIDVLAGDGPLVWLAPHGGARDAERRPWARERLRVNDLHTASLTAELARATGAPALVNARHDRNDVDLNRIVEAHERAPWFLEALADVLTAAIARHGRATLLVVHGWNVVQPAVDLGLGCLPVADPWHVPPASAVSPDFARRALPVLVDALARSGIRATIGARYPARHRENLLQLFTPRYRDDPRPLVRRLAALATQIDAVQLELGIPLRWDGAWRPRFVAACRAAQPALAVPDRHPAAPSPASPRIEATAAPARRLQFSGPNASGLAAIDADGRAGRLLLFSPDGALTLFTGERAGLEAPGRVGPLAVEPNGDGLRIRLAGPLLRFPDATPFLDLERGLGRARLVEADVTLEFQPDHPGGDAGDFGRVTGTLTLDGATRAIEARGFCDAGDAPAPWPRVRAALHWAGGGLSLIVGLDDGSASGFYCGARGHVAVKAATAGLEGAGDGWESIALDVELADGDRLSLRMRVVHRLPVVRAREPAPIRLDFVSCALDGGRPAGWCEIAGRS